MRRITRKSLALSLPTILAATLVCAAASPSAAFYLPDTGQTKCYQAVDPCTEIPCEDTGQDGEYNINLLSYKDNGDGTVTDDNTGLGGSRRTTAMRTTGIRLLGLTIPPTILAARVSVGLSYQETMPIGGSPPSKELMSIVDYAPLPGADHPPDLHEHEIVQPMVRQGLDATSRERGKATPAGIDWKTLCFCAKEEQAEL